MASSGVELIAEGAMALAAEDIEGRWLGDELIQLRSLLDRCEAQWSRRVEVFDGRGDGHADGHRSTVGWLADRCRQDVGDATREVRAARALRTLPNVKDAWEAGRTTRAHVQRLARVRHVAKADQHFDNLEATWLELCVEQDTKVLATALAGFMDRLDNTRPVEESSAADEINRRMLAGSECLGAGLLEARFDLLDYQYVMDAIDAERDRAHTEGDQRTVDQERADAFVQICRPILAAHTRPSDLPADVSMIVDEPTLAGIEAGLCETDRGLPLCVETVRRLACGARIGRILVENTTRSSISAPPNDSSVSANAAPCVTATAAAAFPDAAGR